MVIFTILVIKSDGCSSRVLATPIQRQIGESIRLGVKALTTDKKVNTKDSLSTSVLGGKKGTKGIFASDYTWLKYV